MVLSVIAEISNNEPAIKKPEKFRAFTKIEQF